MGFDFIFYCVTPHTLYSAWLNAAARRGLGRWKTRGRGPGVRGPGVRGPGVWKMRGLVENAGSGGKRGV